MIHIVTAANRCLFEDELLEFWRIDRGHSVCAVVWKTDDLANGFDRFDNDDAVHIIATEGGRICGASRLIPTSMPHRLGDIFPHLAATRGVPRDPVVYEWTAGSSRSHVRRRRTTGAPSSCGRTGAGAPRPVSPRH